MPSACVASLSSRERRPRSSRDASRGRTASAANASSWWSTRRRITKRSVRVGLARWRGKDHARCAACWSADAARSGRRRIAPMKRRSASRGPDGRRGSGARAVATSRSASTARSVAADADPVGARGACVTRFAAASVESRPISVSFCSAGRGDGHAQRLAAFGRRVRGAFRHCGTKAGVAARLQAFQEVLRRGPAQRARREVAEGEVQPRAVQALVPASIGLPKRERPKRGDGVDRCMPGRFAQRQGHEELDPVDDAIEEPVGNAVHEFHSGCRAAIAVGVATRASQAPCGCRAHG